MTNEEIINSKPAEDLVLNPDGTHNKFYATNSTEDIMRAYAEIVMDLARKDERAEVIAEIEKWFKAEVFAKLRGNLPIGEIFEKLNSLKQ